MESGGVKTQIDNDRIRDRVQSAMPQSCCRQSGLGPHFSSHGKPSYILSFPSN